MSANATALAALRREIDTIDERLHDLLMERAEVVSRVALAKGTAPSGPQPQIVYPAREAQVVRRLLARHHGRLPKTTVVRIWREIIAASVRMQGALAIAAYPGSAGAVIRDVARDHFGATTAVTLFDQAEAAFRWVASTPGALCLMPLPSESESWWQVLVASQPVKVVARLPIAGGGGGAIAIGAFEQGASGDDVTLAITVHDRPIDAATVKRAATDGIAASLAAVTATDGPNNKRTYLALLEIAGAETEIAPKLTAFREALRIERAIAVGGYAAPITI